MALKLVACLAGKMVDSMAGGLVVGWAADSVGLLGLKLVADSVVRSVVGWAVRLAVR